MSKCPLCFTPLNAWNQAAFQCQTVCPEKEDRVASTYHGSTTFGRWVTTVQVPVAEGVPQWPSSVLCEACGDRTSAEVCPRCHYALPIAWRRSQTVCISMAGARATGKTFFIAVMKRWLERALRYDASGLAFDYGSDETRANYEQLYEAPLFEERRIIKATPVVGTAKSELRPLVFDLEGADRRKYHLVVRDVAGEDLESADVQANLQREAFGFLGRSDAIVFMVDPMRVRSVREMLQGLAGEGQVGADPMVVLNSLMTALARDGRTCPPMAVVLSKFDYLQGLRDVQGTHWSQVMGNYGAAFIRDPSTGRATYDEQDGALLHQEVRSLLLELGAQALVLQVERSTPDYRFFATSTLGQPSQGTQLHPRGISPYRVTDPVKWVLAQHGVIARVQ